MQNMYEVYFLLLPEICTEVSSTRFVTYTQHNKRIWNTYRRICIPEPSAIEVKIAMKKKSPKIYNIPAELIKTQGPTLANKRNW